MNRTLLLLSVFCALAAGCKHKIGDSCSTGLDCDPEGGRMCDIAQPGGYCTVDGCTATSCPSNSVCIRFFPRQYLTSVCDSEHPCAASEVCLPEGLCAPSDAERRYCMKTCSGNNNDDCRSRYECRLAGTAGSVPLTNNQNRTIKFCAAMDTRIIVDALPPEDAIHWFDARPDIPPASDAPDVGDPPDGPAMIDAPTSDDANDDGPGAPVDAVSPGDATDL